MTKNRKIKFRAWDKEIEKMFKVVNVKDGFRQLEKDEITTSQLFDENSILIPLQFTGLKDKNGKEIYEGDIVEFEEPEFESDIVKGVVNFDEGCFRARTKDGNYALFTILEFEVISNIYENPELLKNYDQK